MQDAALGLIVLYDPVARVDVHLLEELAVDQARLARRQRAHLIRVRVGVRVRVRVRVSVSMARLT